MTRSITRRKATVAGILLTAVALAVTACSSGGTSLPGSGSGSSPSAADSVFAGAPVADVAAIIPGSTMEKIKKRGKLIVAEALDAPLLSQQNPTDPSQVNGFDADLAKLLAIYILGKPNVEIVPPASETREAMLQNGTVDVVFNTYTITPQRAEQIDFAGPYFESGLAVAVKSDNKSIKSEKDLDGKNVIVGANTPAVTEVPNVAPTAKVTAFATDPAAVQALIQGRGDAYVQDYTLLASDAASEKQIKVVGNPFTKEPYGIGLQHGDSQFKSFINTWLKAIQSGGQWAKAWQASLGTVTDGSAPTPPEIGSVPGS
ncbi:glutamate ABC transporter substrate-binding protein [Microbacterium candidum]|uniref:Glutamate ABC transporter substrate-binding protein n=1 Tax=Microbacterium candidum TaxID=3041922 RepID=A0ABT7N0G7_9MICO|nr:glutamate ABC transporter substrate-binding protein [Microbacterium sp. ASV49]MDL9980200.1 glutamate ABC transporter substrate-binding protein [Microbacterium sp. ASV49]